MRRTVFFASMATAVFAAGSAFSEDGHAHHGSFGDVGTVSFANSCSPAVQADLARGVAMLHSFWYSAGERTFRDVLATDPACAVADWGIAAILMANPLAGAGPSPKNAEKAQAAIDEGRRIGAKTQRERDYIEAVAAYYADWANRAERARQEARARAFEALAARYPDDDEAQIFSALYIAGTQSQADQTYAAHARAASILNDQYARHPDHPGITHYLIHVYDAPPLAAQGLDAARRYSALAPDAPHALHMPSHIFTRVGAWEESADANHRAVKAAIAGDELGEAYHATDYAVYAELQMARDDAALSDMEGALSIDASASAPWIAAYASAAMPARYALERGDWRGAMQLEPAPARLPQTESITWFARALGAARSGDVDAAEQDASRLAALLTALEDSKNTYWASEVKVQQITAAAWIALARNKIDDALSLMRTAADLEDRTEKHIVTPGRVLPARELLGDMLMQADLPALALGEYEASQQREPNRFRGNYGAGCAAEAAGDHDKAAAYYGRLIALARDSDSSRPELARARAFVAE